MMPGFLTPAQIRGARGMLDWSMLDLGKAARVSISTVKRVEQGVAATVSQATVQQIGNALEVAGVRFMPDEGDGPGLRLRPREVTPVARFF